VNDEPLCTAHEVLVLTGVGFASAAFGLAVIVTLRWLRWAR
jgi:hypothetical protein